jgi:TonB family protein
MASYLKLILILIFSVVVISCSKTSTTASTATKSKKTEESIVLKNKVLVFQDGSYEDFNLDKMPIPTQGEDNFYRELYSNLKYPLIARNNGTQGSVMFSVDIDKSGEVKGITKITSLSAECDKVADTAIRKASRKGFKPYKYEGTPVKVKYLIPVNFVIR